MEICIFYSWQNQYKDFCDRIIGKALEKAVKELKSESPNPTYTILRGGGGLIGSEDITDGINRALECTANIVVADYTNTGAKPRYNKTTNEWKKVRCAPNANTIYETSKAEARLGKKQIIKVYNKSYGDCDLNMDMPFDIRQERFPIGFSITNKTTKEEKKAILQRLTNDLKSAIEESTKAYIDNQETLYWPFIPMRNVFKQNTFSQLFRITEKFTLICKKIEEGKSFRVLGLPGLGKTRLVCEAFRGKDKDVCYCDCKDTSDDHIKEKFISLNNNTNSKNTFILDNCTQSLSSRINEIIIEYGFNCQLITIYYDPGEYIDTGIDVVYLYTSDNDLVVQALVNEIPSISQEDKTAIIDMSGGFPLMTKMMCDNYVNGESIADVSKKDVFDRILKIDKSNNSDVEKFNVLIAFSIFKFIGLFNAHEKQGRFISNNKIITPLSSTDKEYNLQLFRRVFAEYEKISVLERHGNLVSMRLIPLAIYLCKIWFDHQTVDTIKELINQILSLEDDGTKNMLIEGMSRRIKLLAGVPLAKELELGLTDSEHSPFLHEEVILTKLGSRLFLAFSEVNPEACAFTICEILKNKSDSQIRELDYDVRRNLVWALDHLAFDRRSFKCAMIALARLSLVETEQEISNNSTGVFVNRFAILLPGTEVNLSKRLELLKHMSVEQQYSNLVLKAIAKALDIRHFQRTGGAEKQGLVSLVDYNPSGKEAYEYINQCFDMYLSFDGIYSSIDMISSVIAMNARKYYLTGWEELLIKMLNEISPKLNYAWDEMKSSLKGLLKYDISKRDGVKENIFKQWVELLTPKDYLYRLINVRSSLDFEYSLSSEDYFKHIHEEYKRMAAELIDKEYYEDEHLIHSIMTSSCCHYHVYGKRLSEYGKSRGVQEIILMKLLRVVLETDVTHNGIILLANYVSCITDNIILEKLYTTIKNSSKKYLLIALYAIKEESDKKLDELFVFLDSNEIKLSDFNYYYEFLPWQRYNIKYVSERLLKYGEEGAIIVFYKCHNVLYKTGDLEVKEEFLDIARQCLYKIGADGALQDEYIYAECIRAYLASNSDSTLIMHFQKIMETILSGKYMKNYYYLGILYRQILKANINLIKPRLQYLLENKTERAAWIDLMKSSYPHEEKEDVPCYTIIPYEEWEEWLENGKNQEDIAFVLVSIYKFSENDVVNPYMIKLLNNHFSDKVISAFSHRLHSFSWMGSPVPLLNQRIDLCKDYAANLTNAEAKQWFIKNIDILKKEINAENLRIAHENAIYDKY